MSEPHVNRSRGELDATIATLRGEVAARDARIAELQTALVIRDRAGVSGWDVCRLCLGTVANPHDDLTGLGHDEKCPAKDIRYER
jgi:hypothetical protein